MASMTIPEWALRLLDLGLLAVLGYQLYRVARGTAAIPVLIGLAAVYAVWKVLDAAGLRYTADALGEFIGVGILIVAIVFQQEIRSFLRMIGSRDVLRPLTRRLAFATSDAGGWTKEGIEAVVDGLLTTTERGEGALVVFARSTPLTALVTSQVPLDARPDAPLVASVFAKSSPLHDGALLLERGRIIGAAAILPTTSRTDLPSAWGLRHRAALGTAEHSDAVALVVSEESGGWSLAYDAEVHVVTGPEDAVLHVLELLDLTPPQTAS
jgi:DNA integrity scanning protein DisA with diadenylate cyclase activity